MAAFLPKYFEAQFSLAPGDAAMLVGVIVVPAGAGGTLTGGYLAKRFKLNRAGLIKLYILCQFVVLPLYFGFLWHCPSAELAGVTAPYPDGHSQVATASLEAQCNAECDGGCAGAGDYDPVCANDRLTYFNPCFAGCSESINSTHFGDCSCLQNGQTASRGICDSAK